MQIPDNKKKQTITKTILKSTQILEKSQKNKQIQKNYSDTQNTKISKRNNKNTNSTEIQKATRILQTN